MTDNAAAFEAAHKILTALALDAHERSLTDPSWQAKADTYRKRRDDLDPDDAETLAQVIRSDGATLLSLS
ncbi:hypothetical protein ACIGO9_30645 [Nocardia asteroides]|uniref:hypothetical protein n=1 Tax=Nocardia asteroides TaxID=1824 RepID=UPI0037C54428